MNKKIIRTHKVKLYPNEEQEEYFKKACGVARFAFNWGLNEWNIAYQNNMKVSGYDLRDKFTKLKDDDNFTWLKEVSKYTYSNAILDMAEAWKKFFKKESKGRPKFKSKHKSKMSFREDGATRYSLSVKDNMLFIPNWKKVPIRMAEIPRYNGKIKQVTISYCGYWFASIVYELDSFPNELPRYSTRVKKVGVDLGIKTLATMSDGWKWEKIQVKKMDKKIAKNQKSLSRKQKNSNNYNKAKTKLKIAYYRKRCKIQNELHELTTYLVKKYNTIVIEDLSPSNMLKNHKLAKHIADAQFYEFRRMLEYKVERLQARGSNVNIIVANRFYPSTQTCSNCGCIKEGDKKLRLSDRVYKCDKCGKKIDRDLNAALVLELLAS